MNAQSGLIHIGFFCLRRIWNSPCGVSKNHSLPSRGSRSMMPEPVEQTASRRSLPPRRPAAGCGGCRRRRRRPSAASAARRVSSFSALAAGSPLIGRRIGQLEAGGEGVGGVGAAEARQPQRRAGADDRQGEDQRPEQPQPAPAAAGRPAGWRFRAAEGCGRRKALGGVGFEITGRILSRTCRRSSPACRRGSGRRPCPCPGR